jgi:hypothetical protein
LAHLRNRHHRDSFSPPSSTRPWLIPGMQASTAALRLSVERSADEEAADRPCLEATRRALLKTTETMLGPVPAFTAAFPAGAARRLATPPLEPSSGSARCSAPLTGSLPSPGRAC